MMSYPALITMHAILVGICIWQQFKIRSLERKVRSYETLIKWRNTTMSDHDVQEMFNDLYNKISGNNEKEKTKKGS